MSHRHTAWGRRPKTNQIIFSAERCCKVINIRVVMHQVLKPRNQDLFWQRMPFTSFNDFSWPGLSGKDRKYKLMRSTIPLNICISSAVTPVASLSTNAIADKPNSRIILPKWNDSVFRVHEGGTEQLIIQKGEIYRPRCNHDNFFSSLLCFSILAFPCRSLLSNLPQVVILNIHKCLKLMPTWRRRMIQPNNVSMMMMLTEKEKTKNQDVDFSWQQMLRSKVQRTFQHRMWKVHVKEF